MAIVTRICIIVTNISAPNMRVLNAAKSISVATEAAITLCCFMYTYPMIPQKITGYVNTPNIPIYACML